MTKVFKKMEKKLVRKQRKNTSKGLRDKDVEPATLEVDDEAKVLDKELLLDAVKNDVEEEIESVDLNLIEKQNKVKPVEIQCKLALGSTDHIVALATVMTSDDPSHTCHGIPLGDENMRVSIYAPLEDRTLIPHSVKDEIHSETSYGQLALLEKETVYFMDSLKRRLISGEFRVVVEIAIAMFNAHQNKKGQAAITWKNLVGIPSQPSDKECRYYVMRYMNDIIEDIELSFAEKWDRRGNHVPIYDQEDIDKVRNELANYVVTNHLKL